MALQPRRLDIALTVRGLAETRTRAQAEIEAGCVRVNGRTCRKAATSVADTDQIECDASHPFASRGGLKLTAALDEFGVAPKSMACLDIGASTGGFTDCLLQRGALHVTAVDVGSGQMAARLATDPRVTLRENVNARYLVPSDFAQQFDLAVIDVSFISLALILPPISQLMRRDSGRVIALIKPQFEVGRMRLGAGGIVLEECLRLQAVTRVIQAADNAGLACLARMDSPIAGGDGNKEYLALFRRIR